MQFEDKECCFHHISNKVSHLGADYIPHLIQKVVLFTSRHWKKTPKMLNVILKINLKKSKRWQILINLTQYTCSLQNTCSLEIKLKIKYQSTWFSIYNLCICRCITLVSNQRTSDMLLETHALNILVAFKNKTFHAIYCSY